MKKTTLTLLTLVLASSLAAKATTPFTVNFDAAGSSAGGGTNYAGAGADTGGVTAEDWNPLVFDGETSSDVTSVGTSTDITFTDDSQDAASGGATDIALFDPFFLTHSTSTETLNNVPAGTYDLYIYSQNGGYHGKVGGAFTLDGTTQNVEGDNADHSSFIDGVNYTEFTNVTPTDGTISFTYTVAPIHDGEFYANVEGDFNGVQLVEIEAPEPSTWAMMLAGLVFLGFRFRLKRD